MFAAIDVPPELQDLHALTVGLAYDVYTPLQPLGEAREFRAHADLLHESPPGVLMIDDGYLRLSHSGRTVRFFRDGDLLQVVPEQPASTRLTSELLTRTTWISAERFGQALAADSGLLQRWNAYQDAQFQLMAAICAQYATDDHQLAMKLKNCKAGDVLLRQGQRAGEVLVMIEGSASVLVNDVHVGMIRAGEFIGEMGFLTETDSGATVVASEDCVLQVIDNDSFASVVRSRPHTMFVLARTLAERLRRSNQLSAAARHSLSKLGV